MTRLTWDEYAMALARTAALRSEDTFVAVGAVILDAGHVVRGVGYNGTFSGVDIDWTDRETRRSYVIHAEQNALRYVTPDTVKGGTIVCTHIPCDVCTKLIASYGISRIVWGSTLDVHRYPLSVVEDIAMKTGIAVIHHDH